MDSVYQMLEKVYAPNAPTFSQLSQTLDELRDGVIVGSLTAFRRERIENGGFRLFLKSGTRVRCDRQAQIP